LFEEVSHGGHVGFSSLSEEDYWTEKKVLDFMEDLCGN